MGGKQLGFSDYELTTAKKQTKREKFLAEMEAVVPWAALIALIEPHYPKVSKKGGRPPYPLATMLRIHLLLQWYSLSDPAMEEALIEVPTGLSLRSRSMPGPSVPLWPRKPTYDTHESSERAALKELLSSLELEGTLIQADALHTTQAFFAGASPKGPTCS